MFEENFQDAIKGHAPTCNPQNKATIFCAKSNSSYI